MNKIRVNYRINAETFQKLRDFCKKHPTITQTKIIELGILNQLRLFIDDKKELMQIAIIEQKTKATNYDALIKFQMQKASFRHTFLTCLKDMMAKGALHKDVCDFIILCKQKAKECGWKKHHADLVTMEKYLKNKMQWYRLRQEAKEQSIDRMSLLMERVWKGRGDQSPQYEHD